MIVFIITSLLSSLEFSKDTLTFEKKRYLQIIKYLILPMSHSNTGFFVNLLQKRVRIQIFVIMNSLTYGKHLTEWDTFTSDLR
jgi:hypothetical protein